METQSLTENCPNLMFDTATSGYYKYQRNLWNYQVVVAFYQIHQLRVRLRKNISIDHYC